MPDQSQAPNRQPQAGEGNAGAGADDPAQAIALESLLDRLDLGEKVALVSGVDQWTTPGISRLGIPPLKFSDGPIGVRGASELGTTSACFPCGTALGATWDPDLLFEVGQALGQEARTKGAHVVLGPTVNIHRSPLAGRNFECYSEDPVLTGRLAVGYVRGLQSTGVGATVKHFVCNDSEFERMTISSQVGERALRQIYLVPFRDAVVDGGAWAVMSAYNRINGTYACDHTELIRGVLKNEWSFDGVVISDWWGTKSTEASARAGLDLEMPGPAAFWGDKLIEAVMQGRVEEADLDDKVRRILRLAQRTGALGTALLFGSAEGTGTPGSRAAAEPERSVDRPEPERSVDDPAHRELARRAAVSGMVLLKNDRGAEGEPVLPLDAGSLRTLAVIGPNADVARIQGGGSARVEPHYQISPLEGLRHRAGTGVEVFFERACAIDRSTPALDSRLIDAARVEFFANDRFEGDPVTVIEAGRLEFTWHGTMHPDLKLGSFSARATTRLTPLITGRHRLALTSAGFSRLALTGEVVVDNWTKQTKGTSYFGLGTTEVNAEVELTAGEVYDLVVEFAARPNWPMAGFIAGCAQPDPDDLMESAVALARRCDAAVVVVGLNSGWETEGRDRTTMSLAGDQDELVARVAAANPNTVVVVNAGSPVAMDWALDVPAILQIWYPGQELGHALAEVVFGDSGPGGRLPTTFP
ncbi:MAG: glycoside hydrolase family 3 protein, partial [Acidimicrobiales bacterium]